jgi:multiple sugar transport system permease protein
MADGTSARVGVMTPAMAGARRAGSMKRFAQRRSTTAFLLCLPLILLVAGFVVYPAFYAIWLSLLNKKMTAFVGLGNFAFLLKRNTFQLVIFQSCLFAITAVIAKAILGFIIAHLMHNIPGKNQRIWRGLLLVPWVVPLALSTLTWWWMFDPSYSAFNWILEEFGFVPDPRRCRILRSAWRHASHQGDRGMSSTTAVAQSFLKRGAPTAAYTASAPGHPAAATCTHGQRYLGRIHRG